MDCNYGGAQILETQFRFHQLIEADQQNLAISNGKKSVHVSTKLAFIIRRKCDIRLEIHEILLNHQKHLIFRSSRIPPISSDGETSVFHVCKDESEKNNTIFVQHTVFSNTDVDERNKIVDLFFDFYKTFKIYRYINQKCFQSSAEHNIYSKVVRLLLPEDITDPKVYYMVSDSSILSKIQAKSKCKHTT